MRMTRQRIAMIYSGAAVGPNNDSLSLFSLPLTVSLFLFQCFLSIWEGQICLLCTGKASDLWLVGWTHASVPEALDIVSTATESIEHHGRLIWPIEIYCQSADFYLLQGHMFLPSLSPFQHNLMPHTAPTGDSERRTALLSSCYLFIRSVRQDSAMTGLTAH